MFESSNMFEEKRETLLIFNISYLADWFKQMPLSHEFLNSCGSVDVLALWYYEILCNAHVLT